MTPAIPVITAFVAAVLGFLGAALTANVIANRVRTRTLSGDGGVPGLEQAIRAHGNFVEQAPLALILLGFAETVAVRPLVVEILGIVLIAARLSNAYGLNRSLGESRARQFGGGASVVLPAATSIAILLALVGIR
jgi:uncharacterized membrane protein YecN with MAPEG domain